MVPAIRLPPPAGGGQRDPMADYEIRRAGVEDAEALVAQWATVVDERVWLGAEPGFDQADRVARMRVSLADPAHATFAAVDAGGEIIGQGHIERHPYGVGELGMAVAAGWRRRGVGYALLAAIADWARDHDVHKLALQCWPHNDAALALYERFGFVPRGPARPALPPAQRRPVERRDHGPRPRRPGRFRGAPRPVTPPRCARSGSGARGRSSARRRRRR